MNILITGGCGYIGSVLIPSLLKKGHKIISIDTQFFGNFLPKHKNLKNIKLDISKIQDKHFKNINTVIHLASISNDPSALINSKITWETNVLNTLKLLNLSKKNKIKKFIFASSGSVYGISKKKKVDEKSNLIPISDYNKTKMIGEQLAEGFKNFFNIVILRPGTVCGISRSLRLDLTVNAMTFSALRNKTINVNGGNQVRPHVHIEDMVDTYHFFIERKKINGTYNVGFENHSIINIAKIIKNKIPSVSIKIKKSIDPRSYRLYSRKILKKGFKPKKNIEIAIREFIKNYNLNRVFNNPKSYRASYLQKIIK